LWAPRLHLIQRLARTAMVSSGRQPRPHLASEPDVSPQARITPKNWLALRLESIPEHSQAASCQFEYFREAGLVWPVSGGSWLAWLQGQLVQWAGFSGRSHDRSGRGHRCGSRSGSRSGAGHHVRLERKGGAKRTHGGAQISRTFILSLKPTHVIYPR
jgi:hypothetical protein